jgi:hypothetical protein
MFVCVCVCVCACVCVIACMCVYVIYFSSLEKFAIMENYLEHLAVIRNVLLAMKLMLYDLHSSAH